MWKLHRGFEVEVCGSYIETKWEIHRQVDAEVTRLTVGEGGRKCEVKA